MAGLLDSTQRLSFDMLFFLFFFEVLFWILESRCYFWFSLAVFLQSYNTGLILSGKLTLLWDSFHKNLRSLSISFTVSLSSHVSLSRWSTPPFSFPCPPPISVLSLLSLVFFSVWTDAKQADLFFLCRTLDHIQLVWDLEPRRLSPSLGSKTKWGKRQNLNDFYENKRTTRKKFAQYFWLASWREHRRRDKQPAITVRS